MKIELMEYLSNEITDFNLLKQMLVALDKISFENMEKLIKTLKECDYNEYVYEVAVNSEVLEERTIEDQIKLMKEMKICHGENIEKIANLAEFKMYLEKLKKELGRDADVNNYTKVLRFKPQTKEEK